MASKKPTTKLFDWKAQVQKYENLSEVHIEYKFSNNKVFKRPANYNAVTAPNSTPTP